MSSSISLDIYIVCTSESSLWTQLLHPSAASVIPSDSPVALLFPSLPSSFSDNLSSERPSDCSSKPLPSCPIVLQPSTRSLLLAVLLLLRISCRLLLAHSTCSSGTDGATYVSALGIALKAYRQVPEVKRHGYCLHRRLMTRSGVVQVVNNCLAQ